MVKHNQTFQTLCCRVRLSVKQNKRCRVKRTRTNLFKLWTNKSSHSLNIFFSELFVFYSDFGWFHWCYQNPTAFSLISLLTCCRIPETNHSCYSFCLKVRMLLVKIRLSLLLYFLAVVGLLFFQSSCNEIDYFACSYFVVVALTLPTMILLLK